MKKILVIQTASTGDVILVTPLLEKLHHLYPDGVLDILIKKGNEGLFDAHPYLRQVWIWDKKMHKHRHLAGLILRIREEKYDLAINCQRFFATGLITALSKAKISSGFRKNPLSLFFSHRYPHAIGKANIHEAHRNLTLISFLGGSDDYPVRLYPSQLHEALVSQYKTRAYICIAPASLWFTKQYPERKWTEFIDALPGDLMVILLGSNADKDLCNRIGSFATHPFILNLAGKLNLLQSASLMRDARMNFVNDSAPLHLASAVNGPVAAVFCSTVPEFGFGPLSSISYTVEAKDKPTCRPCGLHGRNACPEKHFNCAHRITTEQLLQCL